MNSQHRKVHPPRLVDVFDDGFWQRGQLEAWIISSRGYRALVRYGTTSGYQINHPRWVDSTRVRPRTLPHPIEAQPDTA